MSSELNNSLSGGATSTLGEKHARGRMWFVAGGILCLLIMLALVLWYGASVKRVVLVVNGETQEVNTRAEHVAELLEEQNIEMTPHDDVSINPDEELVNGDELVVKHAQPYNLIVGGAEVELLSTMDTVREALEEWQVEIGEEDEVHPSLDAELESLPHGQIQVVRVHRSYEEESEEIPFQTVERDNAEMLVGKTEVVQEGQTGVKKRKIELVWRDSEMVDQSVVEEWVEHEPVEHVVAVGTQQPVVVASVEPEASTQSVSKENVDFNYKQVLSDVTLTAYDAGVNSTGKSEGHPQYGITYTGTTVTEGRTVAVDPKVIPLNWWIYIDGIGFRKAEDIGGAIKGNKIDVYMSTEREALNFGRQRGYTVYVIGPEKPPGA